MKKHGLKKYKKTAPKKLKFPNISRSITESPFFREGWEKLAPLALKTRKLASRKLHPNVEYGTIFFISILFLIAIGFIVVDIKRNTLERERLRQERVALEKEISYWSDIVNKHAGYRDGYYKLAVLKYKMGDREEAREYLEKALEIDPNFKEGRELERTLNNF